MLHSGLAFFQFVWVRGTTQTVILGIIMLTMGLTLTTQDFKILAQRPLDILIGACAQFLIMPCVAYLLVHVFQLEPALALGILLVGMGEIKLGDFPSVEHHLLYISVFVAHLRRLDFQGLAIAQTHFQIRQIRCSEHVLVAAGTNRIETHHRENVPSRHLTTVVVATQTIDVILVKTVHDLTKPVLGLVRLRTPIVEIGDMMRRLIAMVVAAHPL